MVTVVDMSFTGIIICTINCSFALTKLDVLDSLPELKIGVAYMKDGKKLDYFPCKSSNGGTSTVWQHSASYSRVPCLCYFHCS